MEAQNGITPHLDNQIEHGIAPLGRCSTVAMAEAHAENLPH